MNTYEQFRQISTKRLALIEDGGLGSVLKIVRSTTQYNPVTKRVETVTVEYVTSGLKINFKIYDWKNSSIQDTDVNFYIHPVSKTTTPDPDWIPDVDQGETEADRPMIEQTVDTPEALPTDVIEFLNQKFTVIITRPWNHAGILIGHKVQARVM